MREELNRRDGKTVVLATHNLHEAEVLADRLAILARGRVRESGTPREVCRSVVSEEHFLLEVAWADELPEGPFRVVRDERRGGAGQLMLAPRDGVELGAVLQSLLAAGVAIRSCREVEIDLEEAFARILDAPEEDAP